LFSGLFSLPVAPADGAAVARQASAAVCQQASAAEFQPSATAFESFIAGSENALLRSLASAVTHRDLPYNPIVLYGAAGTGKSSVASGLVSLRRQQFDFSEVIQTTGVDLARALAHAVDTASVGDLRARHRRCDILLVDDVHRLAGKAAAQEFLVGTLDALTHRGSLVIVTLRQSPVATARLSPQLVSRLMAGVVVGLALPGPLARRELVRQAATRMRLPLSEAEVSRLACSGPASRDPFLPNPFITAARLRQSVLRLAAEGELGDSRVIAKSPRTEPSRVKSVCRQAAIAVAKHFGLTLGELKSKSRRQVVADARGLAMYVSRQLTGASYAEIGRQFGNRDHTTVLHAFQKFAAASDRDRSMRQLIEELATQIAGCPDVCEEVV
jgi:chromosomal replication initiator protein